MRSGRSVVTNNRLEHNARLVFVANELQQMHGKAYAIAFLEDFGAETADADRILALIAPPIVQTSWIPTRHSFPTVTVRDSLAECVAALNALKVTFDEGLRDGRVVPCRCGKADCPTFVIEHEFCARLESERDRVLTHANAALSELGVRAPFRSR